MLLFALFHVEVNEFNILLNFKGALCLIKHYAVKVYGGIKLYLRAFLYSTLSEGELSDSFVGRSIKESRHIINKRSILTFRKRVKFLLLLITRIFVNKITVIDNSINYRQLNKLIIIKLPIIFSNSRNGKV